MLTLKNTVKSCKLNKNSFHKLNCQSNLFLSKALVKFLLNDIFLKQGSMGL